MPSVGIDDTRLCYRLLYLEFEESEMTTPTMGLLFELFPLTLDVSGARTGY